MLNTAFVVPIFTTVEYGYKDAAHGVALHRAEECVLISIGRMHTEAGAGFNPKLEETEKTTHLCTRLSLHGAGSDPRHARVRTQLSAKVEYPRLIS